MMSSRRRQFWRESLENKPASHGNFICPRERPIAPIRHHGLLARLVEHAPVRLATLARFPHVRAGTGVFMNAVMAIGCGTALLVSAPIARAQVIEVSPSGEAIVTSSTNQPRPYTPASVAAPTALKAALAVAGTQTEMSADLIEAVAWTESRFNPSARSMRGAIGVMQLMPATAQTLHVDPHQSVQNIRGGATYLRAMLQEFDGNLELALAAYNAGPEAVRRFHGVPPYPETQAFVASVLDYLAELADGANSR